MNLLLICSMISSNFGRDQTVYFNFLPKMRCRFDQIFQVAQRFRKSVKVGARVTEVVVRELVLDHILEVEESLINPQNALEVSVARIEVDGHWQSRHLTRT